MCVNIRLSVCSGGYASRRFDPRTSSCPSCHVTVQHQREPLESRRVSCGRMLILRCMLLASAPFRSGPALQKRAPHTSTFRLPRAVSSHGARTRYLRLITSLSAGPCDLQLALQLCYFGILEPHELLELCDLQLEDLDRLSQIDHLGGAAPTSPSGIRPPPPARASTTTPKRQHVR